MLEHVYFGPWINWAHGPLSGATFTIGDRSGALLTAFIATFVTIVGAQLFKILVFIFHQSRSEESAQDGLYHQQQVIFRNTATPSSAAWSFLKQSWTWSGKARMAWFRTLPWAFFCLAYMCLFAVAAVFSSEITKGPGTARLVIGDTCGYWAPDDSSSIQSLEVYAKYTANESLAAAAYARTCYGGSFDVLGCSKYTKPSLTTTINTNVSCPFADGMCWVGDKSAYEVTAKIDSLYDLGINSRPQDRLEIQRIATCAPISQKGFYDTLAGGTASGIGRANDTIYQYMYGPSKLGTTDINATDYTFQYNDHSTMDSAGYKLSVVTHNAGPLGVSGGWDPVPELNRTDADVALVFITQSGIAYSDPVDDPVFSAHILNDLSSIVAGADYYFADYYVNTMACVDQYKICNPNNNKCTPAAGVNQILPWIAYNNKKELDLNIVQQAISMRLMRSVMTGSIGSVLFAMAENALLAKDVLVSGTMSSGLPNNQWQREVDGWVNKGLADFQRKIIEYATGPPHITKGSHVEQPWTDDKTELGLAAKAMCYSQMINDTTNTISFSIVGMIVLFAVGGIILIVSLFIDIIVGWFQLRLGRGLHARMCWHLDDKLQLQRYLNQELGHGQWNNKYDDMPSTISDQSFYTLAHTHQKGELDEKPNMAGDSGYQNAAYQSTEYQSPAGHQHTGYQQLSGYQPPVYQNATPSFPPPPNQPSAYPRYTQVTTTEETWLPK